MKNLDCIVLGIACIIRLYMAIRDDEGDDIAMIWIMLAIVFFTK